MKIRNIIFSVLACLCIFSSCTPETRPVYDEIKLGQSYIGFAAEGGNIKTTLSTTADWEITGMTAEDTWLTINPISGEAGDFDLTFTAEALAEGSRELNLVLKCAGKEQKIIVKQSAGAAEVKVYTIAEVLAFTDAETGKVVAVKGAISRISGPQYGEFYIKDEAGNELLIYNSQPSFDEIKPAVGDVVTVEGPFTIYKGTYELNKGTKIIAIERSLIQLPTSAYDVEVPGAEISVPATVKGDGLKVTVDEKSGSWVTYQGNVPGEDGMINLLFVIASNEKAGPRTATVTLSTISGGTTSEAVVTFNQKGDIPETQITVNQFIKEADGAWVSLKGVVTGVHKKGFVLTDAENNSLYIYSNDKPSFVIGDEVIATGSKDDYNGCFQLGNPIVEKVASGKTPYYPAPLECTDALWEEMSTAKSPFIAKYVSVTAVPSGKYGDLKFGTGCSVSPYQTSDEFNYPANFTDKTVTLKGYVLQVYTSNGAKQLRVLPVSIEESTDNGGEVTPPDQPVTGNTEEVFMKDAGLANGTSIKDAPVTLGSLTFTYVDGGNTNEAKYYNSGNALRIYYPNGIKISSTKVITKLEISADSASNAVQNPTVDTGTITVTDGVAIWTGEATSVTITPDQTKTSGNYRIASVKAYYKE